MVHPQAAGFTPRYEWHGRSRHIVWRCCGEDARQGDKQIVSYRNENGQTIKCIENRHVCECLICGRTNGWNEVEE